MATSTQLLTLKDFRRLYAHQDKAYEYWFGEAVPKGMPTTLHGTTQGVVFTLLDELGYFTSLEVELRIHPQWEPRPDVLGSARPLEQPYPTSGADLFVVEILSPDDAWGKVREKCKNYEKLTRIGFIWFLDPDNREGYLWNAASQNTEPIASLVLPNGDELALSTIWERADRKLGKTKSYIG